MPGYRLALVESHRLAQASGTRLRRRVKPRPFAPRHECEADGSGGTAHKADVLCSQRTARHGVSTLQTRAVSRFKLNAVLPHIEHVGATTLRIPNVEVRLA